MRWGLFLLQQQLERYDRQKLSVGWVLEGGGRDRLNIVLVLTWPYRIKSRQVTVNNPWQTGQNPGRVEEP